MSPATPDTPSPSPAVSRRLSFKLIGALVVFSGLAALCVTAFQLHANYRAQQAELAKELDTLEDAHLRSLAEALWVADEVLLRAMVHGLAVHEAVDHLVLTAEGGGVWEEGRPVAGKALRRRWPVTYVHKGEPRVLGELRVAASLDKAYARVLDGALDILLAQVITTLLGAAFFFGVFRRLVTRHIKSLALQAAAARPGEPLNASLRRRPNPPRSRDELDLLTASLNRMSHQLHQAHQHLEERVAERTEALSREVEERTMAQEALAAREREYRELFDNVPVGIFFTDSSGRALKVNPEMARILGAASVEETLEHYQDLANTLYVNPEDRREVVACLKATGAVDNYEYEAKRLDGGHLWLSMSARVRERLEDGGFHIDGFAMDITERRQAREALAESERRFRHILESVEMVAVQGYDIERRVTYWNRASENLYGYTAQEALGKRLEDLIIPEAMREGAVEAVGRWLREGLAIPAGELELVRKDGSHVHVHSSHVMLQGPEGPEMYCIDVDLTEYRQAQADLVRAKEQAEEASRTKSQFLANMSHEIRTPLNGVLGMLQLMQTTSLDAEQDEYVQAAVDSSKRLNRLLSDILDLSRVEAGKLSIRAEPFDLPRCVEQVVGLFGPMARQAGLALETVLDPELPSTVQGDAGRLQQVLNNLVGNAVKFAEMGSVTLEATLLPHAPYGTVRVLFCVADTGPGIGDELVGRLFEAFTQASEGADRSHQGAGLGLAISRRLVELMGGAMSVSSAVGEGTTICFSLPFARPEGPGEGALSDVSGAGLAVLLAEDDATSAVAARRMLEKAGCRVTVVGDGEAALAALRERAYDAVLMDVQMPGLDGSRATRAIREGLAGAARRGVPIIGLTGYAMAGDRERFLAEGMDGYVPKPLDREALLAELRRVTRPGGGAA